jgi:hypothetical protein
MSAHPEPSTNRLKQILMLDGPEFLGQAYLLMLGRPADPEGFRNYDAQMRSGTSKLAILTELRASQEGRAYGTNAPDPLVLLAHAPSAVVSPASSLQDLLRLNGSSFVECGFVSTIGCLPSDDLKRLYIAKLNVGTDKLQILLEILDSHGGASPAAKDLEVAIRNMRGGLYPVASSTDELLALDDVAFVDCAYKTLLQRAPDALGVAHYLQLIRSGASKRRIIAQLRLSTEGRRIGCSLRGLKLAIFQYWLASSRLTGWWFRPIAQIEGDTPLECRVRAMQNALMRMVEDRDRETSDLDAAVDDVALLFKALTERRRA